MPLTLIDQKPSFTKKVEGEQKLSIAEMFCDTIQGEGLFAGHPATFLRLQGCTLQCIWCDTLDVWPHGNEYTFDEIFALLESVEGLIERLLMGQHLILTGGSPLKQQKQLSDFLNQFYRKYGRIPFIEVENECVLLPTDDFKKFVSCWNNSPKTHNSGMKLRARYKPDVIQKTASLDNSWFKFVISQESDWQEIENDYLKPKLISKRQIILMPEGQTQEELNKTRKITAEVAIREQVKFTDRTHIVIWNRMTGV